MSKQEIKTSPQINLIYRQYTISRYILERVRSFSRHTREYNVLAKILEYWILLMVNETGSGRENLVFTDINDRSYSYQKLRSLIDEKFSNQGYNPSFNVGYREGYNPNYNQQVHSFFTSIERYIQNEIDKYPYFDQKKSRPIYALADHYQFRDQEISCKDLDFFRQFYPHEEEALVSSFLLYKSMFSRGCQLAAPQDHYRRLYQNYGARNEAFASPFNSQLKYYQDARYFSLFEVDRRLGSSGNFFHTSLLDYEGQWVINPPYLERIILQTAHQILSAFEALDKMNKREEKDKMENKMDKEEDREKLVPTRILTVFMVLPNWFDTEGIELLVQSPYLRIVERLSRNQHNYQTPDGQLILASFDSIYLILSNNTQLTREIRQSDFFDDWTRPI